MKALKGITVAMALLLASPAFGAEIGIIKTSLGTIEVEFFDKKAPKHVANFKKLLSSGFYTGTYFHRVIPGFMIQGGDPNTKDDSRGNDGMGGSGTNLKAEFNDTKHVRGILSMARSQNPDSASSQFFIMTVTAPHLDGQYSAFGKVVKGLDVMDKIVSVERDRGDNPLKPVYILSGKVEERK